MGLNRIRGRISVRITSLNSIIEMKEKALRSAPKGSLLISTSSNSSQYYLTEGRQSKNYIPKQNLDLIKSLAQKDYDSDVLKAAKEEKELLEKLLKKYPKVSPEECYENMPEAKRQLIDPILLTNEEFIAKWEAAEYERKPTTDSEYRFVTNRGETVTSKSEKMIADRLFQRGVPYRYEASLRLKNGIVIHPDFTLLDMKKRREVYYEHMGRMDDPNYVDNALRRMRNYENSGIILCDNLLITMETSKVPINMKAVDNIIDFLSDTN